MEQTIELAAPPVDTSKLLAALGGRKAIVRKVAGSFLQEHARQLASLRLHLDSGEGPEALMLAHRLKGNLSLLRARTASQWAAHIEAALNRGDWPSAKAGLAGLEQELRRVTDALSDLVAE